MSMAEDTRKRPEFSSDHSSNSAREPGSDPLAELARLIGQNDPFNDIGKRGLARKPLDTFKADDRPAPEWLARPASPDRDDDYEQPAAPRAIYAAAPYQAEHHEPAPHYDPPAGTRLSSAGRGARSRAGKPLRARRNEPEYAAHEPATRHVSRRRPLSRRAAERRLRRRRLLRRGRPSCRRKARRGRARPSGAAE